MSEPATAQVSQRTVTSPKGAVQLTVTVVGHGIDSAVFAIEVIPRTAFDLNPIYRFSHVCSPSELVEFPDQMPGDNCYFRTDSITMVFDSALLAEKTLQNIEHDVDSLVKEYNVLNELSDASAGGVINNNIIVDPIDTTTE